MAIFYVYTLFINALCKAYIDYGGFYGECDYGKCEYDECDPNPYHKPYLTYLGTGPFLSPL